MSSYRRVMLKLSGETFGGESGQGLDKAAIKAIAEEIRQVAAAGVELTIVIGGGNFLRGSACEDLGLERGTADYMGMLATMMNALALQTIIETMGYQTRTLSAIESHQICEPYIRRRAIRHMEKGRIIILAGGTGNPYFTTDTAAALRATELGCQVLLKATKVDGIYDKDPKKHPDAVKYKKVTFEEAIQKRLGVMDATAFTLCSENNLPIIVCSIHEPGNMLKAIMGQNIGTLVTHG